MAASKHVKMAAGLRWMPTHGELIRLGFLDYVVELSPGRLFPEWPMAADGYYSSLHTKIFNWMLAKAGVKARKKSPTPCCTAYQTYRTRSIS
ncbi:MAG: hypothetical protein ACM3Q1_16745 [Bacteroidales bacterium]